jgi:hypothetical protein
MKVYVNVPADYVCGGCEALFQLVDAINTSGGFASIIWDRDVRNPIPSKYSHYKIKYGGQVEDDPNNWIIYPEVWTDQIHKFTNMKKGIWWLSVTNNHNKFTEWDNENITHFYQSEYALEHIKNNGGKNYYPLFDYLGDKYLKKEVNFEEKQNVVCYNPAKGRAITTNIMRMNPNIQFIPLVNMNEDQIIDTLLRSKVYIDFGHHPGKDRIPRESAILGNCVITNEEGAARNNFDIPINKKYKSEDMNNVGNLIVDCFDNFEKNITDFSEYIEIIKNQKQEFINQVKKIFI